MCCPNTDNRELNTLVHYIYPGVKLWSESGYRRRILELLRKTELWPKFVQKKSVEEGWVDSYSISLWDNETSTSYRGYQTFAWDLGVPKHDTFFTYSPVFI